MPLPSKIITGLSLSLFTTSWAQAGEFEFSGSIGLEARTFFDEAQFDKQLDVFQGSTILEPELRWESDDRAHQIVVKPFARLDSEDDERTHVDLREGYWRYTDDTWEVLAGAAKVFWGVTESRHLVDIINQSDTVEDTDEEDKLGQPMVRATAFTDWGDLSFFIMPYFRERTFPGAEGRLRTPLPVAADDARYESDQERFYPDVAFRYSHYFGDWDVGVSLFHGTSREPIFDGVNAAGEFIPFYQIITQLGTDIQYTTGSWLWKFEGIVREGQGDTFGAVAAGFEYTFFQIGGSDKDLGLLMEYLGDGRDDTAPVTIFDNDIFVGTRLAFNDTQDTSILFGAITDLENGSTGLRLEAERRIGDSFKLELESQIFAETDEDDPTQAFEQDSFATVRFSYFY